MKASYTDSWGNTLVGEFQCNWESYEDYLNASGDADSEETRAAWADWRHDLGVLFVGADMYEENSRNLTFED